VLVRENERERLREYLTSRLDGPDAAVTLPTRRVRQVRIVSSAGGLRVDDEIVRTAGPEAARLVSEGGVVIQVERHALQFLVP
jgi:hypothetical protein